MRGHIIKRGKRYAIVVDIGRDHNGKRKQKWFSGYEKKKDAEKDMPKIISKIEGGNYVEPSDMTFKEYMEQWLKRKKNEISYGTYHHYESYTRNHIIPGLGRWKLNNLKSSHIDSFLDSLDDKNLSKRTQRHIYRVLSNAIKRGAKYGVPQNILNDIDAPKVPKKRIEYWNEEEVRRYIEHLKGEQHFIPIFLAITTGMRQGEVLGLRWEDIDLNKKYISVTQQLRKKEEKDDSGRYELTPELKTESSYRTISIDDRTVNELKQHKDRQDQDKQSVGKDYKDLGLVCATSTGNYIIPSNINRVFWRVIDKAKVKKITFHAMRHTHATILLKQGVHPKVVQERLGHRSIQITLDTYSHVIPGLQEAAATKLGSTLFDPKDDEK